MAHPNAQLARDLLAAMESFDVDRFDSLLSEDVRQWVPESAAARTGIARPTEGLEAVKSIYARGPERYEHLRFEPTLVIADDDGAAVFARSHGKLRDGREFSNEYAFFYRVVDGRVTEVWEHPDTAYAFDFFGI